MQHRLSQKLSLTESDRLIQKRVECNRNSGKQRGSSGREVSFKWSLRAVGQTQLQKSLKEWKQKPSAHSQIRREMLSLLCEIGLE